MANLVKEGYLAYYAFEPEKGVIWYSRYYRLIGQSENQKSRLDWYPNEHIEGKSSSGSIYIQSVTQAEQVEGDQVQPFIFELTVREATYRFAVNSKEDLDLWLSVLRQEMANSRTGLTRSPAVPPLRPHAPIKTEDKEAVVPHRCSRQESIFTVQPIEGDSTRILKLSVNTDYLLCVSCVAITLCQQNKDAVPKAHWDLTYIRRYGKANQQFTIEAGRKCESGDGIFNFAPIGCTGLDIFNEVQQRVKEKANHVKTTSSGSTGASPDASSKDPCISTKTVPPSPYLNKSTPAPPVRTKPNPKTTPPTENPLNGNKIFSHDIHNRDLPSRPTEDVDEHQNYYNTYPDSSKDLATVNMQLKVKMPGSKESPDSGYEDNAAHSQFPLEKVEADDAYSSVEDCENPVIANSDGYCDPKSLLQDNEHRKLSSALTALKGQKGEEHEEVYDRIDFKPSLPSTGREEQPSDEYGQLSNVPSTKKTSRR